MNSPGMIMESFYDLCVSIMPELEGLDLDIQELKGGITNLDSHVSFLS